jgi:arsenate reductase
MVEIWHNSRCSKSRAAFNYLKDNNIEFKVKEYLKEPPTKDELQKILKKLNKKPSEIIRKKEAIFKELNLKDASEDELLEAMVNNPKLIERPIIINNNIAVIARPLEEIEKVVKDA